MFLTHGSLFSGIGGFDLGFERVGIKTLWQVENNKYANNVLSKRFPNTQKYGDIKQVGKHNLERVGIISGGFPCQPFSTAGKRKGDGDDRYLWPEMFRVISELQPTYVVAENVRGFMSLGDGRYLEQVYTDLESQNYETFPPLVLPACGFGAPHKRERVWIVAHSRSEEPGRVSSFRRQEMAAIGSSRQIISDPSGTGLSLRNESEHSTETNGRIVARRESLGIYSKDGREQWAIEPSVGRVAHGIPSRVDRLRGLGNAIIPQIAEWIGNRILDVELRLK